MFAAWTVWGVRGLRLFSLLLNKSVLLLGAPAGCGKAQWRVLYGRSTAHCGQYCPSLSLKQVSQKNIPPAFILPLWAVQSICFGCIVQLVGEAGSFFQRGRMHTSMRTSCNALMHLGALTSIQRDNGQLSRAVQAKKLEWRRCVVIVKRTAVTD